MIVKKIILSSTVALAFLCMNYSCQPANETGSDKSVILPDRDNGGITLPENFGAAVVVDTLGRGRHLVVNDNGDIYVHLRRLTPDGHAIIAMRDNDGDGRADEMEGFSEVTGTGIRIHNGFLYYSSRTEVYRSRLIEGSLVPDSGIDTLVRMVDGTGHMEKTFDFDGKGNMYVNIGSATNACQEQPRSKESPGVDPCIELETRAGIWKFSDSQLNQDQDLSKRYATGIRNAVAINWNKEVDRLYILQHGRDDLHRFWPEYYTEEDNLELPAEEFMDVEEGDDFGWPYCYYNQFEGKRILNPEYGGDGTITDRCENAKNPLIGFPGHWGPNDLHFYKGSMFPEKYRQGAFVAFHGSWNRLGHEQQGYKVVFIPMQDGKPAGDWEIFADGFSGGSIESSGDALYRPCGLAEGPDGSLFIVDSQKGRVWRIMYYPKGIPDYHESIVSEPEEIKEEEETDQAFLAGKDVYNMYCAACHMPNGKGAPGLNPPLIGTKYVLEDEERLIGIVLNGLNEPIEIQGEVYQNIMAPHSFLSNRQIADVLSYVRNSWGNKARAITEEEVAVVRDSQ
jgi:glucose/arabinose dehydrogenase